MDGDHHPSSAHDLARSHTVASTPSAVSSGGRWGGSSRNKKRHATEFDPLILARLVSMEAAPPTPPCLPVDGREALASTGTGKEEDEDEDEEDEEGWLTFPTAPSHVPMPSCGGGERPEDDEMLTNTTTTTATTSSLMDSMEPMSAAVASTPPGTATKVGSRRYSLAVGPPSREALERLRATPLPPLPRRPPQPVSTTATSAYGSSALASALSSSWTALHHHRAAPDAAPPVETFRDDLGSTSPLASAPYRKESKGEADYQRLRELALSEDFEDLEKRKALYMGGKDNFGRQVVVFALYKLGDKVDFERLLLYIIKAMDKIVEEEYALVFCQTHMTAVHRPPFAWLRKAYSMFQRKYKKNLKAAYILHASTLVRMTLKLFKPFISNKFWRKLVYIDEVTDIYKHIRPDQLVLPDEVLSYKRESRASPLFGLPLAAGCARNPSISGLPIICERAFEVLDTRAAIELEGIFRVSGSTALLNDLKQRFDRGEDVDLGFADAHTVAGLLKLYLRELPEPLLTFRLYESLIRVVRRSRAWEDIQDELTTLVRQLPAENYTLSAHLYRLLGRVANSSEKNLMNVNNLAIVIGPNVMRAPPEAPPDRLILDAGAINSLVRLLIQHSQALFPLSSLSEP